MPRFCANLTMLYGEHDFLDRFAAAARGRLRAGSSISSPTPSRRRRSPRRSSGTAWSRFCTTCRPATGTRASAASPAFPAATGEFQDGVGRAIDYATRPRLPAGELPGRHPARGVPTPERVRRDARRELALRRRRARRGRASGSCSSRSTPSTSRASIVEPGRRRRATIIDEVGSHEPLPPVRLLPPAAHGGRLAATYRRAARTGSRTSRSPTTRAATSPAPARSTTPSCSIRSTARATTGWVGCEYKPKAHDRAPGLAGSQPYRGRGRATPTRGDTGHERSVSSGSASWAGPWRGIC